ncbi:MAG: hypothetical protein P4L39_07115 [Humidesulfovibrio sp.]|nr:hypothetical protein [Humidesulfovibrio sp.]
MPHIEWQDSLVLGIKTLNDQHKGLVETINSLLDAKDNSGQACRAREDDLR